MKHLYWVLPLLTGSMLASIHMLPEAGEMEKSAIEMDLPEVNAGWIFKKQPASKIETDILAPDTEFSKAVCLRARQGEFDIATGLAVPDRVDLSIVLSGHDLNNSIHRPERCMPSQGHIISETSDVVIRLENGQTITARRLLSVQSIPTNEERTEHENFNCVTYYFFVGNSRITQDHLKRTLP